MTNNARWEQLLRSQRYQGVVHALQVALSPAYLHVSQLQLRARHVRICVQTLKLTVCKHSNKQAAEAP